MNKPIKTSWQSRTRDEVQALCMQHNFWTWSAQAEVDPLPVERAQGVFLYDFDGQAYLDFNASVMCVNLGHGDGRVIDAIAEQARTLAFAGPHTATRVRAELGRKLAGLTPPGLDRFLFTLGGADAIENAIKLARGHSGRAKILAGYNSYHGATHGALAVTGDSRRLAWEPFLMPGVVHFHTPYPYRSIFPAHRQDSDPARVASDYLDYLEQVVKSEGPSTIAAILLETVVGTNGVLVPPDGYLQGVQELCRRHGILLICDEVMAGFGRTGTWFAVEHWNVVPDLMVMAKGLTSGYAPLGALAMTDEVARSFDHRTYQGGLTFNGHPISLAAAIANLEALEQDGCIDHAHALEPVLLEELESLKSHCEIVGDVRGIGLFGAIELVEDRESRKPLERVPDGIPALKYVQRLARERGLFVSGRGPILLVVPPLIITPEQLREGFRKLDACLQDLQARVMDPGSVRAS
jgi:taurine--2-oxoglutarate transaminase